VHRSLLFILASIRFLVAEESYQTEKDLLYRVDDGSLGEDQRERCRLDLYRPTSSKGFATIVWFHGGGLTSGEKHIPKALMELDGYGHQIPDPAHPLLLRFIKRIIESRTPTNSK